MSGKTGEVTKKVVARLKRESGLSPIEKPLLVSACFVALLDETFYANWKTYSREAELACVVVGVVRIQHECGGITGKPLEVIAGCYKFINSLDGEVVYDILTIIEHVIDADSKSAIIDGVFNAFKAGGKGTGIVLTPVHITEFMCDLADINSGECCSRSLLRHWCFYAHCSGADAESK